MEIKKEDEIKEDFNRQKVLNELKEEEKQDRIKSINLFIKANLRDMNHYKKMIEKMKESIEENLREIEELSS